MRHLILVLFSFYLFSCSPEGQPPEGKSESESETLRVASLVPSITELLYELGLDKEIVAVTEHCIVPKHVDKAKLSTGAMNPTLESILEKEPSLVFSMTNRPDIQAKMRALGIRVEQVKTVTFEETMQYFDFVGKLVGKEVEAKALIESCRSSLDKAVLSVENKGQRALLSIASLYDKPGKANPWIAGQGNLYDDLLDHFKMKNAYQGEKNYLKLSTESLLELDPDVIFILKPFKMSPEIYAKELKAWQDKVPDLKAVKEQKIYVLGGDYMMLTGPRIPLIIRDFQEALQKVSK